MLEFLLTHPVWDVTNNTIILSFILLISTHTSRVGCDSAAALIVELRSNFYSHIPCGMWQHRQNYMQLIPNFYSHIPCGMWQEVESIEWVCKNFYSHIPCGMWPTVSRGREVWKSISTHTSRVGCDFNSLGAVLAPLAISTHTSRVGCESARTATNFMKYEFLLTHPVWDVTQYNGNGSVVSSNFYSHIPCGMWRCNRSSRNTGRKFLLTHPVWDVTYIRLVSDECRQFLLTHPVWDVTSQRVQAIKH